MSVGLFVSLLSCLQANANGFATLSGHGGPIMGLAYSATDARALSGSFDYSVGYWPDISDETSKPIWLEGHKAAVNSVAFWGKIGAVSGGDDFALIIWDLATATALHRLEGHKGKVLSVKVSKNQKLIASAGWDGRAGLWDAQTGKHLRWFEGHKSSLNDVAFSDDAAILYTASHDGTVRSWDVATGAQRRIETRHGFGVNRLIINDAQGWLVYGALDGGTRVIDIKTGTVLADITLDRKPILSLALNNDASRLAVGDGNGYIMVLDTADWTVARDFRAVKAGPVWALAYANDGRLLSGGLDETIAIWPLDGRIAAQGPDKQPFHRPPAEMENGERQFVRKCSICHNLGASPDRRAGPPLGTLFGRRAGTAKGYSYSSALTSSNVVWNEETIMELFRIGPDALTPGSKMPMQQIAKEQDRRDLVNYLKRVTRAHDTR
ncbi:MAG: c-type cytochrome [Rhizobiales bacterium]|nr:c-type cytochrome [Hyphomicrobiales bacterium]